ncbi:aminotransferase class III-fold pyridoxal phosphate-dependent enzyme [Fimbriimonas ginsengisoli]|uniref:Putative glutamate-1-semialdehyde 2,1-aminomutase n=1 Tax=Fimbriimonas ginsengisoli Gsoil 348 TaxID=661478 RepID=A0A068NSY3_FIMGI|nr:aminotransferase class III-fold pyridoxal phosphate-dependent enzyme [Fimbriimonas ginsengisoli]AIE86633.1 putative glutamate-1-semialdehyde 2,1-aminomutase [Fimbriimonas ginsengisoli Gsoil 348]
MATPTDVLTGTALWSKAKRLIPGGNGILSKRSERYLPDYWPAYYSRAKGCEVWDLEGKHYWDFAQMGVGACTLGYADDDVDAAVIEAVRRSVMCTLNAPEEVELAEKLLELHPWAEMARFAKTGGEACAIAVRIGRAASGRDLIAFCGYHGWTDWYLAANLQNKEALDAQLLPGLDTAGVPGSLKGTALTFNYNHLEELEALVAANPGKVGVIMMEPMRGSYPVPGFLEGVRAIADRIGAVLIFDEVTSAFRVNRGAIHHTLTEVRPDLAVFGKALGNGYAISGVLGKRSVMDVAQDSFISSTMWSERTGFCAALAAIKKMENEPVQERLVATGEAIGEGWKALAKKHGIPIGVSGCPPLTSLSFKVENPLALQTLYAQEMLKRGYLLGAAVYTTYSYTDEIVNRFLETSDEVWKILAEALDAGNVVERLDGGVASPGFRRLT